MYSIPSALFYPTSSSSSSRAISQEARIGNFGSRQASAQILVTDAQSLYNLTPSAVVAVEQRQVARTTSVPSALEAGVAGF